MNSFIKLMNESVNMVETRDIDLYKLTFFKLLIKQKNRVRLINNN